MDSVLFELLNSEERILLINILFPQQKFKALKLSSEVMSVAGGKGIWSLQAEYLYPKLKAHNQPVQLSTKGTGEKQVLYCSLHGKH